MAEPRLRPSKELRSQYRIKRIYCRCSPDTLAKLKKIASARKKESLSMHSVADVLMFSVDMYYASLFGDESCND